MNTKFPLRLLLIILAIVHVHDVAWPKNPLYTRHVKPLRFLNLGPVYMVVWDPQVL